MKYKGLRMAVMVMLFSIGFNSNAQPPAHIAYHLQEILDDAVGTSQAINPGGIMEVVVPGQWTWSGASGDAIYGLTPGWNQTAANPTDKFRAGSISKVFMTTVIFHLQSHGLLQITDTIDNYLSSTIVSDTLMSSDFVTIEMLLTHQSGINELADNGGCQTNVFANPNDPVPLELGVYCGASLGEQFTPGTSYDYSNTNFVLLAMIVEDVTGDDYWNYVQDSIIDPLGLINTSPAPADTIPGAHMGCYFILPPTIDLSIIDPTIYKGWADIVSTTSDLNTFHDSLRAGAVISLADYNTMTTMIGTNYGMGTELFTVGGDDYWGHSGDVGNTSGMFYSFMSTTEYPDGYYISYNFTNQGINISSEVDGPVYDLLNTDFTGISSNPDTFISVYPNPADHKLNFFGLEQLSDVKITDLKGNVVLSVTLEKDETIDVSELASGMYILHLSNEEQLFTDRIFIK